MESPIRPASRFTRRDFLKLAGLSLGGLAFRRWTNQSSPVNPFPEGARLGRVTVGKTEVKSGPGFDHQTVADIYEDQVVVWLRETVGWDTLRINQRWVETPDGYIWAPYLQPVRNSINTPITMLPAPNGMWVDVTIPYVDLTLDNPPARSPGLKDRIDLGLPPRLYYSQVVWVDQIKVDDQGQTWYRINERYGSYGDILWAAADAFRPLSVEEMAPIHPEIEDKRVIVNVAYQTISCFEGQQEIYFARVSTGILSEGYATPLGEYPIWRKLVSVHMSGGTTGGGWDLPGVAWTSLFVGSGVAIHSTYWHNNFGEPMSHGCVNAQPEDAKWIFRWTQPVVPYEPGDVTVQMPGGTKVQVIEI